MVETKKDIPFCDHGIERHITDCRLENNPVSCRTFPVPCMEDGKKRLPGKEHEILFDDESRIHVEFFFCSYAAAYAAKPGISTTKTVFLNVRGFELPQYLCRMDRYSLPINVIEITIHQQNRTEE